MAMASPSLRQLFQRFQNAVGSGIDCNRRAVTPGDHSVLVDHEQSAFAAAVARAVGPVFLRDVALRLEIRKQREMQMTVLGKCFMTPGAVHGNTQKRRAMALKVGENLVVECELVAANGTPI